MFRIIAMIFIALTGVIGILTSVGLLVSDGWTSGVVTKYALSLATVVLVVIAPLLSAYIIWGTLRKGDT